MYQKNLFKQAAYKKVTIDNRLLCPCVVLGKEKWLVGNQGELYVIESITLLVSNFQDLVACCEGKEIKFICYEMQYFGYSAKISQIDANKNFITFHFDIDSFEILISENASLG